MPINGSANYSGMITLQNVWVVAECGTSVKLKAEMAVKTCK